MRKLIALIVIAALLLPTACASPDSERNAAVDTALLQFAPIFVNLDAHAALWASVARSVSAWLSAPDEETARAASSACAAAQAELAALIPDAPKLDDATRAAFSAAGMDTLELISAFTAQQTFFELSCGQLESMAVLTGAGEAGMDIVAAALEFNLSYNGCEYKANYLVLNELFAKYPDSATLPFRDSVLSQLPYLSAYLSPWEQSAETCALRTEALIQKQTELYADYAEAVGRFERELLERTPPLLTVYPFPNDIRA